MRTLDLARKNVTLEHLLKMAAVGSVRIVAADGHAFVLEEADAFEKEVQLLGKSRKFRRFLNVRSKQSNGVTLDKYRESLG